MKAPSPGPLFVVLATVLLAGRAHASAAGLNVNESAAAAMPSAPPVTPTSAEVPSSGPAVTPAPAPTASAPRPGLTLDAEPRFSLPLNRDFPAKWLVTLIGTFGFDLTVLRPGLRLGVGTASCDRDAACDGRSMLLYGGGVLGLPLLRRERVRLELEAGYGFGAGASTKWWHGPETGVFLGFAGEPTPWSSLPPWYGFKLSAQQWFAAKSLADENTLLLGFSLVYRVQ
jgi:hypothetical protein